MYNSAEQRRLPVVNICFIIKCQQLHVKNHMITWVSIFLNSLELAQSYKLSTTYRYMKPCFLVPVKYFFSFCFNLTD